MTMTEQKPVTIGDLTLKDITALEMLYCKTGPTDTYPASTHQAVLARKTQLLAEQNKGLTAWAKAKAAKINPPAKPGVSEKANKEAAPSVKDRPSALESIVGQEDLVGQLRFVIKGSQMRGVPMCHCLFVGPAGHGKTSFSAILAEEIGYDLVCVNSMALRKPQDLIGILVKASNQPTVIQIDEIHNLSTQLMESLYSVMEDAKVDIISGSGMDATTYSHELPEVIICGATTKVGALSEPFRQRFGFIGQMASYTDLELAEIVRRSWDRAGYAYEADEPYQVAKRSRGVPRIALKLGERVLDYAYVATGEKSVSADLAGEALAVFGIDQHGLDDVDYLILDCLVNAHGGQSLGLDSLAAFCDLDPRTISDDHEPYLVRSDLIARSKGGRMALPKAHELMKDRQLA